MIDFLGENTGVIQISIYVQFQRCTWTSCVKHESEASQASDLIYKSLKS